MTRSDAAALAAQWQAADYQLFCELCCDGYGDPGSQILHNPVYRWLKQNVPLSVAADRDPRLPYERMLIVAKYVNIITMPRQAMGADEVSQARKWHQKVQKQIRSLQKTLANDSRISLPRLDKALAWALPMLETCAPKAAQPWLLQLAHELQVKIGSADAQLLLQLADALNLEIDLRTAQRYVKDARKGLNDR